jgi:poly(A) polymerase
VARVTALPDAEWRRWPELVRVVAALTADSGEARYVGGAVRDTLLGLAVADVDLATPLHPDAVVNRLESAGIKAVPTGIAHGTITAVSGGRPFEVTTLRRDVATDGRRATIAFAAEWREDAARRDFTFNALYADPASGEIFDWFGGMQDLFAGTVRFIGDPAQRIAEDHLRILRYYRFVARFGTGPVDADSHAAVVAARHSLRTLSRERVADELLKLLGLPDPLVTVLQMESDAVLSEVLPEADGAATDRLERLLVNEGAAGEDADALRRMAALLPAPDAAAAAAARLRLSNRQRERLEAVTAARAQGLDKPVRRLAYHIGAAAARDSWLLGAHGVDALAALAQLKGWVVPQLPIKGGMLVARGVDAGPDVARLLRQIEAKWVERDFPEGAALDALVDQLLREARQ